MSNLNLLEHFLHNVFRPVGNFFHHLFHHPIDTAVEMVSDTGEWVQDHPYTCVAIVGLGMYANHRGWLKFRDKGAHVNIDAACCLGEAHIHNSFRIGRR